MTTKQPAMDWLGIKAELHRRGMTLSALGAMNDLSSQTMSKVATQPNRRAQAVIARFLNLKPESLWPDRYPEGKPRILDTAKYGRPERKKASSASDSVRAA